MSNTRLYKLAGLSSGLGGLLGAVAHVLHVSPPPTRPNWRNTRP
jgi:hypothetical protein